MRARLDRYQELLRTIEIGGSSCWLWQGTIDDNGYGRIILEGKSQLVHRVAYRLVKGDPGDLQLHHRHTCPKRCFNPDHLSPLTVNEHAVVHRGSTLSHCPAGHEFTPENTRIDPEGYRRCRTCARLNKRGKTWNQGDQARANRAVRNHRYWEERLATETPEEAEARKASYRDRYRQQVADPEKHARRLAGKRERFQRLMATETPEQREARLAKRRAAYRPKES